MLAHNSVFIHLRWTGFERAGRVEPEPKATAGQLSIIRSAGFGCCLAHSSGRGALRLSTSAVSVAGCDPSHMLWTISGASNASGIRRFT